MILLKIILLEKNIKNKYRKLQAVIERDNNVEDFAHRFRKFPICCLSVTSAEG